MTPRAPTGGARNVGRSSTRRRTSGEGSHEGKVKRYRVAAGTQVAHGERLYGEGEQLEATEAGAREWLALGYVEEIARDGPDD